MLELFDSKVIKTAYDRKFHFPFPKEGNPAWISWRQQADFRLEMRQIVFFETMVRIVVRIFFKNTDIFIIKICFHFKPHVGGWGCLRFYTAADCDLPCALAGLWFWQLITVSERVWHLEFWRLFRWYVNARAPERVVALGLWAVGWLLLVVDY